MKVAKQMLHSFTNDIIINSHLITQKITEFLQKFNLPLSLINVEEIYIESSLFLLYSFSD